jgi:hypothetical protein
VLRNFRPKGERRGLWLNMLRRSPSSGARVMVGRNPGIFGRFLRSDAPPRHSGRVALAVLENDGRIRCLTASRGPSSGEGVLPAATSGH